MFRSPALAGSLVLLLLVGAAGCLRTVDPEALTEPPQITAEEARAALLKLESIRVISGKENDPVYVDLKSGAITRVSDSKVEIGSFISCNLKENTWEMSIGNPEIHFHARASGTFERQPNGTWRAIQTGGSIS
jgi:hypothetical protein